MLNNRDQMILEKIIEYCRQITETVTRFGADYETYCGDFVYRNACCMCILQIGELVGKLTEEFTTAHTDIPWRSIKATRNLFAHAYGTVSTKITWQTIRENIPELMDNCQAILQTEATVEEESDEHRR